MARASQHVIRGLRFPTPATSSVFVATIVLAIIVGGGFITFGGAKLANAPMMTEARQHLGLEPGLFKAVGALEVLGGIGVLVGLADPLPVIGALAAVGLIGMTIGGVYYHQRAGDPIKDWLPAVVMGSIAIFYIILRVGSALSSG